MQQSSGQELVEGFERLRLADVRRRGCELELERVADDGGCVQQAPRLRRETGELSAQGDRNVVRKLGPLDEHG